MNPPASKVGKVFFQRNNEFTYHGLTPRQYTVTGSSDTAAKAGWSSDITIFIDTHAGDCSENNRQVYYNRMTFIDIQ